MLTGRKQDEGQGGEIGLFSRVSFFQQGENLSQKLAADFLLYLLVITGSHKPALAAREAEK